MLEWKSPESKSTWRRLYFGSWNANLVHILKMFNCTNINFCFSWNAKTATKQLLQYDRLTLAQIVQVHIVPIQLEVARKAPKNMPKLREQSSLPCNILLLFHSEDQCCKNLPFDQLTMYKALASTRSLFNNTALCYK